MSADDDNNESLYLIDAHSLIYQVFFALPKMSSPDGLPTNALFGFAKDVLYISRELKPAYLVCVFDVPGKIFREDICPDYKAHRSPMPDDLQLQIPMIREMLQAMNVPVLGVEGFEADDVIATLARQAAAKDMNVFICTTDKDCRQLLSERIKMYNLRKREVFDGEALLRDWGVAPEQVIDFQTLVGDSVDNVKGVPGIGPKTATTLLQQYRTLDNLLAHIDEIPGKKQENLRSAADIIETSRKLVTLDTQVPLTLAWDSWRLQSWDNARVRDLFLRYGFRAFAQQVPSSPGMASTRNGAVNRPKRKLVAASTTGERQGTFDFGDDLADDYEREPLTPATPPEEKDDWQATYHLVNSVETLAEFLAGVKEQKRIALDLETTHIEPRRADIVGLAVSWKPGEAWYLALRGPAGETSLDPVVTLAQLKPILEDAAVAKINQNIKFDMQVFRQHGINLAGVAGDPMIADYLLHAGERIHSMEVLSEKYLKHRVIPIADLIGKGKTQKRMDEVPCARVAEYAGEDADVAWRLCEVLEPQIQEHGWKKPDSFAGAADSESYLYDDLEIPLIDVLADMEFTGIRLDSAFLNNLNTEMQGTLARLEKEIHQLAGKEFNIASVKQLREVLFEEQGFRSDRKTSINREASTDQETLERLARQGHDLPQKLLEHRQIAKLQGTYVEALPALVNPSTGRVHASFNQTVAATGRLSSSDPNLQNIPIRSDLGGSIRRAFIPEAGWKLLSADYSQIELRLLAHFCGDEELRRAFAEDRDIHNAVASQVFGVPESDVNAEQRRMAKTINFGLIYGLSAFGLAQRLEISRDDATKFIDAYFARYPRVLEYQEKLLAQSRQLTYVSTILGRRRTIAGIRAKTSYKSRNQPEREAINMQIQGSAADLIKVAMVNLHRILHQENYRTRLLLQIHDELVFEVPPEEVATVAPLIRREMTGALGAKLEVPIGVDMGVGENWLEMEPCV
jgi:DNA polymerase I